MDGVLLRTSGGASAHLVCFCFGEIRFVALILHFMIAGQRVGNTSGPIRIIPDCGSTISCSKGMGCVYGTAASSV